MGWTNTQGGGGGGGRLGAVEVRGWNGNIMKYVDWIQPAQEMVQSVGRGGLNTVMNLRIP
jgi:hypothetical protein